MRARRGFTVLLVLWVAAIAAVIVSAVLGHAYAQAVAGREAVARIRAQWAARAGVELALCRAEFEGQNPDTSNAYSLFDDLASRGDGRLADSAYRLAYSDPRGTHLGVQDAHAKLNLNLMSAAQLAAIPEMPEDGADSIQDWRDSDDDTRPLGAERSYYESQRFPIRIRNGNFRNIAELELVVGMTPQLVRGEDWNLNGRLDPNEDDGDASWPPDNADGLLQGGFSGLLTVSSVDGGLAASGQTRLDLSTASPAQIAQRTGVDSTQAAGISAYGQSSGATMISFIQRDLRQLAQAGGYANANSVRALSREQMAAVYDECTIGAAATAGSPGKLNINTCEAETLQYIPELTPALADAIILERSSRPDGFHSIVDLLDVPSMTRQRLSRIAGILDVKSNAIIVSSRGRDAKTGIEVEIVATIDRSTLPATITEIRVQ
jgi:DNA uptake protein ComE-like DNA-binding protein